MSDDDLDVATFLSIARRIVAKVAAEFKVNDPKAARAFGEGVAEGALSLGVTVTFAPEPRVVVVAEGAGKRLVLGQLKLTKKGEGGDGPRLH